MCALWPFTWLNSPDTVLIELLSTFICVLLRGTSCPHHFRLRTWWAFSLFAFSHYFFHPFPVHTLKMIPRPLSIRPNVNHPSDSSAHPSFLSKHPSLLHATHFVMMLFVSNSLPSLSLPAPLSLFSVVKTSWTPWPSLWWTCGPVLNWGWLRAGTKTATIQRTRCTMRDVLSTSPPQTGRPDTDQAAFELLISNVMSQWISQQKLACLFLLPQMWT